jgi:8-oxo-dGTP pyrophosphatase MutT (NUDIX family)
VRSPVDPEARLLANVEGPVSQALRAAIESPGRQAAVLLALVERSAGLSMLFTERSPHLSQHAGQVSFPGGRLEPGDPDAVATALREAHEEVGLASQQVSVAGCLDEHATGTGFVVTPVVGFVDAGFVAVPNPEEVEAVFEVPLDYLLDAKNFQLSYRERFGSRFRTFELHYDGHLIWGATAAMLVNFREMIDE